MNSNLSRPDSKRRLDIQSMCSLEGALIFRSGLPVFQLSTDLSQLEQASTDLQEVTTENKVNIDTQNFDLGCMPT